MRACAATYCKVPDSGMRPARGSRTSQSRSPPARPRKLEASARTYQQLEDARISDTGNRVRRVTLRILLRARNLVHARRRYWRSAAAPAGSDYRRGPRRLQLRAHRRCGRGDRRRAGVRAGSVQHRRRKPIASARVVGGFRPSPLGVDLGFRSKDRTNERTGRDHMKDPPRFERRKPP